MLELFRVVGRLALDKSGFDSDVQHADESGRNLAENLSTYMEKAKKVIKGLFAVAAIKKAATSVWNLAKETSAAGDRIDKNSQKLGLSRKAYQEWDYILRQSGADIDSMGMAMRTMDAAIAGNSAETAAALSQLGLSSAQLQSLSPEEQFELIVKRLQEMPEGADKSRLALQFFGRSAQSLMPLLNSSADSVEELRQRAHNLGLIMSDDDVDAAVAFGDALDDLNAVWSALKQKFGAQLLPGFTRGLIGAANALGRITTALEKAFKEGDWKGFFGAVTEEISNALPAVMETVVNVIGGVFENADKIVDVAVSIVTGLADGLIKAAPKLVAKLPQIFKSIVDGVKKIFGSLLSTIFGTGPDGGIKWPTWDDVKAAAIRAWETIKNGLATLGKWIFGETDDGAVKWPTWEEVGDAARRAWQGIKDGLASLLTTIGKFIFGETDDGAIDWPTWQEVGEAARAAWQGIKDGLASLLTSIGKFIFGETDDGAIDWPTWEDVQAAAQRAWQGIKDGLAGLATAIGAFVFGTRDDGAINWPTWETVKEKAVSAWRSIKQGLANLVVTIGKWVFGASDEESLSWLDTIKSWLDGSALHEIVLNFGSTVSGWIKRIWDWAQNGINVLVNFFGGGLGSTPQNTFTVDGQTYADPMGVLPPGMGFAKGLNYVPYDGFVAKLHRGETILNQADSRAWRQGQTNSGFNVQQLYSAVSEAVAAAVSGISVNMDGRVVGNLVSEQVSRNIYMAQLGRRFNTV